MPTYKQKVSFDREFVINAKNASEANIKLEDMIREVEFNSDTRCDGFYNFEDDPVECPECRGAGTIGDDGATCPKCNGEGVIPFE